MEDTNKVMKNIMAAAALKRATLTRLNKLTSDRDKLISQITTLLVNGQSDKAIPLQEWLIVLNREIKKAEIEDENYVMASNTADKVFDEDPNMFANLLKMMFADELKSTKVSEKKEDEMEFTTAPSVQVDEESIHTLQENERTTKYQEEALRSQNVDCGSETVVVEDVKQ